MNLGAVMVRIRFFLGDLLVVQLRNMVLSISLLSNCSGLPLRYNPKQLDERWAAESFLSKAAVLHGGGGHTMEGLAFAVLE